MKAILSTITVAISIEINICHNKDLITSRGTSILTSTHPIQSKSISIKTDISHRKEILTRMGTITLISTHHNTLIKIGKTSSNILKVAKTKEIQEMRQQVPIIF